MKKSKLFYICSLTFSLCLIMSSVIFAKYSNDLITGSSSIEIASSILNVHKEISDYETSDTVTRVGSAQYAITVSNFSQDMVSDTAQNYYLQIYSNDVDLSQFEISITKDKKNINLDDYHTDYFYFKSGEKQTHNFIINVSYNGNSFDDINGTIRIKAISMQQNPSGGEDNE